MDYSQKIWAILKPLKNEIEIYEETTNEDFNFLPSNYIIFKVDVTNTSRINADGKPFLRQSNCEIAVFTLGSANDQNNKLYVDKVENELIKNGITYNKINLGYNSDLGKSQVTFEFNLI